MPGLLATQVVSPLDHLLDHVTVADGGLDHLAADALHGDVEPHVAHHGGHQGVVLQGPLLDHFRGADRHDPVAVHHVAVLVHEDDPIRVAVQGDTEIGAVLLDRLAHHLGVQRAALGVDVGAVGLDPDRDHLGAQFLEDCRGHLVGRPVGAVQHDLQAGEIEILGKGALQEHDEAAGGVVDTVGLAHLLGGGAQTVDALGEDQLLHHQFGFVRQLEAVAREELDAVVLKGVVRGRDHHTRVGAHGRGDVGDARGGERPHQEHVHPHGADPRHQGAFQHVAGEPRVLADHDPVAPLAVFKDVGRGAPDLHRHLRGHRIDVGHTADPVGSEQLLHSSLLNKFIE